MHCVRPAAAPADGRSLRLGSSLRGTRMPCPPQCCVRCLWCSRAWSQPAACGVAVACTAIDVHRALCLEELVVYSAFPVHSSPRVPIVNVLPFCDTFVKTKRLTVVVPELQALARCHCFSCELLSVLRSDAGCTKHAALRSPRLPSPHSGGGVLVITIIL